MAGPSKIVIDAIRFAAQKHAGQHRKDGRTPYVSHPFRVLYHLTCAGVTDADTLAAAVLHDTIEDTTADFDDLEKRFNRRVAEYVAVLTKDKRLQDREREDRYFAGLKEASMPVKLVKMGDTLDNLLDATALPPEGAAKAIDKAERLLALYKGKITSEFEHMLRWIESAIDALRETKASEPLAQPPKLETRKRRK